MVESISSNELALEEWEIRSLRRIEPRYQVLSLRNQAGTPIDESALADELARVEGREGIKSLIIEPSSRVTNLRFLQALPGLETLNLNGLQLRSLEGLEWFRQGRFIKVDTGTNRKRSIAQIAAAPITKLILHWASPGDLEAVAGSRTIRELTVSNCPPLSCERWRGVPLESLSLFDGAIDVLADTAHLPWLKKLTLFGCRKLERFAGENSAVEWMVIQQCSRLDLRTIATCGQMAYLTVMGNKTETPLSAFGALGRLRSLSLQDCKVQLDVTNLKRTATQLEELVITGLKKDQVVELSLANTGVMVSNGRWSYMDGTPVNG